MISNVTSGKPTRPAKKDTKASRKATKAMTAMTMAVMLRTKVAALIAPDVAALKRLLSWLKLLVNLNEIALFTIQNHDKFYFRVFILITLHADIAVSPVQIFLFIIRIFYIQIGKIF